MKIDRIQGIIHPTKLLNINGIKKRIVIKRWAPHSQIQKSQPGTIISPLSGMNRPLKQTTNPKSTELARRLGLPL